MFTSSRRRIPYECWNWLCQCNGDTVGDDCQVVLEDFFAFKLAFGSSEGDSNYNACADYDRDLDVDLQDFFTFKDGFAATTVSPDCTPPCVNPL